MKNKLLLSLLTFLSLLTINIRAENNFELYENLANDPWFDYVHAWDRLFSLEKIDHFLELSEGRATKFFIDHCTHVTSVSLITISAADQIFPVYYESLDLFGGSPNWIPKLHIFSEIVDKANEKAATGQNTEIFGTDYINDINQLCMELTEEQQYDAIFIDPRLYIRGDLINCLFNRADIIATHDTNFIPNYYGWHKISPPDNYEEIHFSHGSGTTFWIKKEKHELIEKLKSHAF